MYTQGLGEIYTSQM